MDVFDEKPIMHFNWKSWIGWTRWVHEYLDKREQQHCGCNGMFPPFLFSFSLLIWFPPHGPTGFELFGVRCWPLASSSTQEEEEKKQKTKTQQAECVCVVVLWKHLFEFPPPQKKKKHTQHQTRRTTAISKNFRASLYYSGFFFFYLVEKIYFYRWASIIH